MLLQWHWFKNGIVMIQHFVSSENSELAAKSMKLRKKRKVERKCQLFTWFFLAQMLPSLDIDFSQNEKEQSGDNSSDRRCLKLLLDVVIKMSHLYFFSFILTVILLALPIFSSFFSHSDEMSLTHLSSSSSWDIFALSKMSEAPTSREKNVLFNYSV